jgi:ferritin-like metal-binding protein YciE
MKNNNRTKNQNETQEKKRMPAKNGTQDKNREQDNSEQNQNGGDKDSELQELFLDELADLLSAETQLTKALPKMAKAAEAEELAEAFRSHLTETEGHVNRLKEVFESLGEKAKSKTCKAMKGLIEEGSELMQELKGKKTMDAGLVAAAQKVEHYEIASYGTVIAWARQMGHDGAVSLLEETIGEEKAADEKLTEIADSVANHESE